MGEDPGARGASVGTADTEQLQREIEQTRGELGDTVEALAEKADVKRQAKQKIDGAKASVAEKKDELLGKAKQVSPDTATAAAATATEKARQNPVPVASIAAFAAGYVFGRLSRRD
jgi:chromosome segregation ATPase